MAPITLKTGFSTVEYRAAIDLWRATAPANDDVLFGIPPRRPRKQKTDSPIRAPRHAAIRGHLSDLRSLLDLSGLLSGDCDTYLNPANDNTPEPGEAANDNLVGCDTRYAIRPSVAEIVRAFGAVDYRAAMKRVRRASGPSFDIGGLRFLSKGFWSGEHRYWADELWAYRTGGGTWSKPEEETLPANGYAPRGSEVSRYFLGALRPREMPSMNRRRRKQRPVDWSALPSVLGDVPFDQARANAGLEPAGKSVPPGLPHLPAEYQELFVGGIVGSRGSRGSKLPQTHLEVMIKREDKLALQSSLTPQEHSTVAALRAARTYCDLVDAEGRSDKTAERHGQATLISAAQKAKKIAA